MTKKLESLKKNSAENLNQLTSIPDQALPKLNIKNLVKAIKSYQLELENQNKTLFQLISYAEVF